MTHPSKRKGNRVERLVVDLARKLGLTAERAYASNGKALGHSEEVDCVIEEWRIQVKARKAIPAWQKIPEGADATFVKADGKPIMVWLTMLQWLDLIVELKLLRQQVKDLMEASHEEETELDDDAGTGGVSGTTPKAKGVG